VSSERTRSRPGRDVARFRAARNYGFDAQREAQAAASLEIGLVRYRFRSGDGALRGGGHLLPGAPWGVL
jgi:hypothetical protein